MKGRNRAVPPFRLTGRGGRLGGRGRLGRRSSIEDDRFERSEGVIVGRNHNGAVDDRLLVGFDNFGEGRIDCGTDAEQIRTSVGETEVEDAALEVAVDDVFDALVDGFVHALLDVGELVVRAKVSLVGIRSHHPVAGAEFNRGIEDTGSGAACGGEHDVVVVVVERERQVLAQGRVFEVVGVGRGEDGVRVGGHQASGESDFIPHDGWDADAADHADLAGFGDEAGQDTSQERAFVFLEQIVLDVVVLGDRVDEHEELLRILGRHDVNGVFQQEAIWNGDVTLFDGEGEVGLVVSSRRAFENLPFDSELFRGALTAGVGQVVEVLVADAGCVRHQGGHDRVLGGDIEWASQHSETDRGATGGGQQSASVETGVETSDASHGIPLASRRQPRVSMAKDCCHVDHLPGCIRHGTSRDSAGARAIVATTAAEIGTIRFGCADGTTPRRAGLFLSPRHDPDQFPPARSRMSSHPPHLNLVSLSASSEPASASANPVSDAASLVLACHLLELRAAEVIDDLALGAVALALQAAEDIERNPADGARAAVSAVVRRVESRVPAPVAGIATLGLSSEELLATVGRMIWRDTMLAVFGEAIALSVSAQRLAETHVVTIMPAYLGGQPVQPTTLAHFLGGVIEPLAVARERLRVSIESLDRSPLGAGLLTGDVVGMDRAEAAHRLGFAEAIPSTIDALGELAGPAAAIEAMTAVFVALERFVRELRLWVRTDPTSFVLDEEWTVTPEAAHPALVLGYRLNALEMAIGQMLDRLDSTRLQLRRLDYGPIGMGHDLLIAAALDLGERARPVLGEATELFTIGIVVNRAYLGNRAGRFHTTAPDLAAFLMTEENLPPATARQIAVLVLARIKDMRLEVSGITPDMIDSAALMTIGRELKVEMETLGRFLAPRRYIERRQVTGSAAPDMTREWLSERASSIAHDRAWLAERQSQVHRAFAALREAKEAAAESSPDN